MSGGGDRLDRTRCRSACSTRWHRSYRTSTGPLSLLDHCRPASAHRYRRGRAPHRSPLAIVPRVCRKRQSCNRGNAQSSDGTKTSRVIDAHAAPIGILAAKAITPVTRTMKAATRLPRRSGWIASRSVEHLFDHLFGNDGQKAKEGSLHDTRAADGHFACRHSQRGAGTGQSPSPPTGFAADVLVLATDLDASVATGTDRDRPEATAWKIRISIGSSGRSRKANVSSSLNLASSSHFSEAVSLHSQSETRVSPNRHALATSVATTTSKR